jgi:hypothetical protein
VNAHTTHDSEGAAMYNRSLSFAFPSVLFSLLLLFFTIKKKNKRKRGRIGENLNIPSGPLKEPAPTQASMTKTTK